ncbi:MAG: AHH domain-containing protein [Sphingomonadaceae bacterium]
MNRRGSPAYDPAMQKHHLLPLALVTRGTFDRFFAAVDPGRLLFEDYRANGLLLPCREPQVLKLGLPLHRGPHPRYSEVVWQRVGQIERDWAKATDESSRSKAEHSRMRLLLLQRGLRRQLVAPGRRMRLNMRDPLGEGRDFTELDRMAALLWAATRH